MKKYVKPDLYFESFQLSQNIASCGWDMNHMDITNCETTGDNQRDKGGYDNYSDVPLFVAENDDCLATLENFCYTNGASDEIRLFASN